MSLTPEEQEEIRKRIREDLEHASESGIEPPDPRRVERYTREEGRLHKIERIRREAEDEFYSQQPGYVQYVNRYGVTKWVLEEELRQKRRKGRARRDAKIHARAVQIQSALLYVFALIAAFAGYKFYRNYTRPPVVIFRANVDSTGLVFVNTSMSGIKPNKYSRLSAGEYHIGVAYPGYRTEFKRVHVNPRDTTSVDFTLQPDTSFKPDYAGSWIRRIPAPKVDEPTEITRLRDMSNSGRKLFDPKTSSIDSTKKVSTPVSAQGGIFITSNQPDATVYMNGVPTPLPQNTLLSDLPLGKLTFEVRKPGYRSSPSFQTTNRTNASDRVSFAFELIAEKTVRLKVRTEPVVGEIKLDGMAVGRGSVEPDPGLGTHTISFGDIPGFITPSNQVIDLNERSSDQEIIGVYKPSLDFDMRVDDSGRLKSRNLINIATGYWLPEKGAIPSTEYGPEIIKVKPYEFFAYQFGPGKPNANPSGSDYIEVLFNLPTGFNSDRPLSLVLEGYATNRNFQFNLTKLTEIVIEVNGVVTQSSIRPSVNIDETRSVARDVYPITRHLQTGSNRVLIRLSENAKCYYLLRSLKIE